MHAKSFIIKYSVELRQLIILDSNLCWVWLQPMPSCLINLISLVKACKMQLFSPLNKVQIWVNQFSIHAQLMSNPFSFDIFLRVASKLQSSLVSFFSFYVCFHFTTEPVDHFLSQHFLISLLVLFVVLERWHFMFKKSTALVYSLTYTQFN